MKKLFSILILLLTIYGCSKPVLYKKEYNVVDTLEINYGNFGDFQGAKVIIKYDSTFHYGVLDKSGNLITMNPRNLNVKKI